MSKFIPVLSSVSIEAVKGWSDQMNKADNKRTKMLDALFADGIRAEHCFAPKKGEDRALYASLEKAVVLGFNTVEQKIVNTDRKDLTDEQKITRRALDTKIGARLGDIRRGLNSREVSDSDGAEEGKSSWEETIKLELQKRVDQARKKESSTMKDLLGFIKDLESAISRI
jgi:hypothetical protein